MVDYSKWDHMASSDVSSEEEDEALPALSREAGANEPIGVLVLLCPRAAGAASERRLSDLAGGAFLRGVQRLGWVVSFAELEGASSLLGGGGAEDFDAVMQGVQTAQIEAEDAAAAAMLPPGRTIIGDLGDCGAVTLACGLLLHSGCAGAFTINSCLVSDSFLYDCSGRGAAPEILMVHGASNDRVAPAQGRQTAGKLQELYKAMHIIWESVEGSGQATDGPLLEAVLRWVAGRTRELLGEREDSAPSVAAGLGQEAQRDGFEVTWTVAPPEGKLQKVRFAVPEGAEELLARYPVSVNGGRFELRPAACGSVECQFESPRPEMTAKAIATRLEARVRDPSPPGVDACAIS